MRVEAIRSVIMKCRNGGNQNFQNMKFVPFVVVNIISLGVMAPQEYKYAGSKWECKVYKGRSLVFLG